MSEMKSKKWVSYEKDYSIITEMKEKLKTSELLNRVLINRSMDTIEKAQSFLNPSIELLYDPYKMKGMEKSINRISKAIEEKEKICIYGDYDVDGITSCSIFVKTLKYLNANVIYYIPNRFEEGYGLNIPSIDKLMKENVTLFISVDCGIRSIDVIEYLNKQNIDIIITDHHECGEQIPNAYSVLNPHQKDCTYPFKELAGVGVAFKLIDALLHKYNSSEYLNELLEIVSIGTIADIVPLIDENRVIVKNGLLLVENTSNIGLKALIDVCGLSGKKLNAYHIAFQIAPRMNAAGRLAEANLGVELLLTNNDERAAQIAEILDETNKKRQNIEMEIFLSAVEKIENEVDLKNDKVIILQDDKWHIGVIGIVASRITERYAMPTILIATDGDVGRGSGRSIEGFNIIEAMNQCSHLFEKYGGHELAAGLSIKQNKINDLRKSLNEIANKEYKYKLIPKMMVDYKLTKEDFNISIIKELEYLEPFGCSNPAPNFVYRNLKIKSMRAVGNENKHLSLKVHDGFNEINCIGYNLGNYINILSIGEIIDIICSMEINVWNGTEKIQLVIRDIKSRKTLMEVI